jgi:hypothetical protein
VDALICVAADINVQRFIQIAGVDNEKCDRLSRRGLQSSLSVSEEAADMGCTGVDAVEVNSYDKMIGVLNFERKGLSEAHAYRKVIG